MIEKDAMEHGITVPSLGLYEEDGNRTLHPDPQKLHIAESSYVRNERQSFEITFRKPTRQT